MNLETFVKSNLFEMPISLEIDEIIFRVYDPEYEQFDTLHFYFDDCINEWNVNFKGRSYGGTSMRHAYDKLKINNKDLCRNLP